jgi:hypothetical protein
MAVLFIFGKDYIKCNLTNKVATDVIGSSEPSQLLVALPIAFIYFNKGSMKNRDIHFKL